MARILVIDNEAPSREYLRLHDYFGRDEAAGGNEVLHRLRALRNGVDR